MQDELAAQYDRLAEGYDKHYFSPYDQAENLVVGRLLNEAGANQGHVLDLGCGTGVFLDIMGPRHGYHGLDLSEGMLKRAREKYPDHTFAQGDLEWTDPVEIGRADWVVSLFDPLNYIGDVPQFARRLHAHMRPGARFFVMGGRPRIREKPSHILGGGSDFYRSWFEGGELQRAFASAGFRLVFERGFAEGHRQKSPAEAAVYLDYETRTLTNKATHQGDYAIVTGER